MANEPAEITAARIQAAAVLAAAIMARGERFGDGERLAEINGAVNLHRELLVALGG